MKDLVLFGMQGSGKGTQSVRLAERFGMKIFETGAELRRLSSEDSELARKVKSIIEAGHLVPTEVVMEIIADFMKKLPAGTAVLFDGIPRSLDQKEQFDALMAQEGHDFIGVLIELSETEALKRLTTRRICQNCKATYPAFYEKEVCESCGGPLVTRQDDTPDAIAIRLKTFAEKTVPVLEAYKNEGRMRAVNGEMHIEEVTQELFQVLQDLA